MSDDHAPGTHTATAREVAQFLRVIGQAIDLVAGDDFSIETTTGERMTEIAREVCAMLSQCVSIVATAIDVSPATAISAFANIVGAASRLREGQIEAYRVLLHAAAQQASDRKHAARAVERATKGAPTS